MNKAVFPLLGASLLAGSLLSANGATFAQINQSGTSSKIYQLTGTGSTQSFGTAGTVKGLNFDFQPIDPSDPYPLNPADLSLQGVEIKATELITSSQSGIGTSSAGNASENFHDITITIKANGAQTFGAITIPDGANLLTVTSGFVTGASNKGGTLTGAITSHGGAPTFSGADVSGTPTIFDNVVTFSSSYIDFTGALDKGYSYGLSNATPNFSLHTGFPSYINKFSAQGLGTFSATFVPEPGSMSLLAGLATSGLAAKCLLRRRRK